MRSVFFLLFSFLLFFAQAQDTLYARQVLKYLTSEKCFGRGYLKNGLNNAAKFIVSELQKENAQPLFGKTFYQEFQFDVNTFPNKMELSIDGKKLIAGKDFIVSPESRGMKGKFELAKKDSITFFSKTEKDVLVLSLKNKLTFSVAQKAENYCEIDLLDTLSFRVARSMRAYREMISIDSSRYGLQRGGEPTRTDINFITAEVNISNKVIHNFKAKNICAFFEGTQNNDTMILFTAHYDHLGGMGKHTFFAGANDNASGVSFVLNLVKHYKQNPPKYKTLFIFFAGEEAGLLGSKYFVESKAIDLKKIKFLINLDLLGSGEDGIMVVNGAIHEKEFDLLNNINSEKLLVKEIKKRGKARNSDHYWFSEAAVPSFFIYTMGESVKAYHDVFDVEPLPLSDYVDVFKLMTAFVEQF
ncbi:MAG: M28 family peptidase [Bacteroidetes bacterium]|nr:M28 family peptidase [Bacteroidota bacterium]